MTTASPWPDGSWSLSNTSNLLTQMIVPELAFGEVIVGVGCHAGLSTLNLETSQRRSAARFMMLCKQDQTI